MISKSTKITLAGVAASVLMGAMPAAAESAWNVENWQFRVRAIGVLPDTESTVNIGGDADVGNAVVPEFDITYFFTKNIAAELILATSPHSLDYNGSTDLGDTWILPPTLTLQYHFMPDQNFSPYIGAGVNYSVFYGSDAGDGYRDLDMQGGFGVAAQAGFDYWLNENWGLNLDVKKIWLDVEATLNEGTVDADVALDPWIVGAGVSYRF